jgi:Protein of unknown function (DUF4232)
MAASARYGRYALRTVAVVAFAGTAALAVVVTSAPEHAVLIAENLACTSSGLDARVGMAIDRGINRGINRRASTRLPDTAEYYTLEFINISHRPCVLEGYPSVDAYTGTRQIGSPATLDTTIRPRTVTLAPGGTAHTTLHYIGTGQFGRAACRQVTAPWLRVYPTRQDWSVLVRLRIPACSRRGPHFLSVQAIQPRSGIPRSLKS